jgi:hypothetical protein
MRVTGIVIAVVMVSMAFAVYFGLDHVPDELMPGFIQRSPETAQTAPPAAPPVAATQPVTAAAPAPAMIDPEDELADLDEQATVDPDEVEEATELSAAEEPVLVDEDFEYEEPAQAPAPKAPTMTKVAAAQPTSPRAPVRSKPPAADLITQWWPDPAGMPENQLKLVYAGQVQNQPAIALLFSAPVNLETLREHAEVITETGNRVGLTWEAGNNPRMALLSQVPPGRYTVILNPPIADTQGYLLGTTLQGPVYIQPN